MSNINKCKVVILPQQTQACKKGSIVKTIERCPYHNIIGELEIGGFDFAGLKPPYLLDKRLQPQHLYFAIDDVEPKDFETVICIANGVNFGKIVQKKAPFGVIAFVKATGWRTIVASTDTSLGLPVIPESFIREYVKAQGNITEVNISIVNNEVVIGNCFDEANKSPEITLSNDSLTATSTIKNNDKNTI